MSVGDLSGTYLALSGGVLTGEATVDNLGLEFTAGDDHTDCTAFSATGGGIFFDDSEGIFKKCQDNVLTDLDTGGGTVNTADIADVNVTATEFAELETMGDTTISAAQWVGLGGATAAGIALWDDADAAAQLATLGLTATASEINTPLDGASVTLTEFQELETIGATTISAAQWGYLGGFDQDLQTGDDVTFNSVTTAASATPGITMDDSNSASETDDAKIYANATDTGAGTEDVDVFFQTQVNSVLTTIVQIDADGNLEIALDADLASGKAYKIDGTQIDIGDLGAGGNWTPTGTINLQSATATAATPSADDNDTSVATTAYVQTEIAAFDTEAEIEAMIDTLANLTSIGTAATEIDVNDALALDDDASLDMDATANGMADDKYNGITLSGWNCGESISQWDSVYLDDTSNEWMQADADAAGEFPARGIMVAACTDGNPGIVLVQGVIRDDTFNYANNGETLYLSDVAGGDPLEDPPSTSGDCVQVVGFALDDDHIYVNFSGEYMEVE